MKIYENKGNFQIMFCRNKGKFKKIFLKNNNKTIKTMVRVKIKNKENKE